jgi:hypothetical protein
MKLVQLVLLITFAVVVVSAQDPPKKDTPYLIHATNLLETETSEATEESDKKAQIYAVPGSASPVRTPLGFPEFLFATSEIDPASLELYGFTSVNGRRELLIRKKKKVVARKYFVDVIPQGEGVFKLRVDSSLARGEYCLTPGGESGSNTVFCFAVL